MKFCWFEATRQCRQIAARILWRTQIWWTHRKLASAERELGELAWQQADFDDNDSSARELQSTEKEQARLVFEIAEIKEDFHDFTNLSDAKKNVLQAQIDSTETRAELLGLRVNQLKKLLALEIARGAATYLIESEEKSILLEQTELDSAQSKLHAFRVNLTEIEEEFRHETERVLAALKVMETRLAGLQEKKPIHFGRIGQELADVGIAPLNQPQALEKVLYLRCGVAVCKQKIRHSHLLRQQLNPTTIYLAWVLLVSIFLIIFGLFYWLIF